MTKRIASEPQVEFPEQQRLEQPELSEESAAAPGERTDLWRPSKPEAKSDLAPVTASLEHSDPGLDPDWEDIFDHGPAPEVNQESQLVNLEARLLNETDRNWPRFRLPDPLAAPPEPAQPPAAMGAGEWPISAPVLPAASHPSLTEPAAVPIPLTRLKRPVSGSRPALTPVAPPQPDPVGSDPSSFPGGRGKTPLPEGPRTAPTSENRMQTATPGTLFQAADRKARNFIIMLIVFGMLLLIVIGALYSLLMRL